MIGHAMQTVAKTILKDMEAKGLGGHIPAPHWLPTSRTMNPYWDIVRTLPGGIPFSLNPSKSWEPDTCLHLRAAGYDWNQLRRLYCWAIPDPDSLDFVAKHLGKSAVEIGAGNGYWAWQLTQLGVDILAYDLNPHKNNWCDGTSWSAVAVGDFKVLSDTAKERALFLSWPPMSGMAWACLKAFKGTRLVYIGEGHGGCTANDKFHELLDKSWTEVESHKPVQWWGIHDWITVYDRK